MTQFPQTLSLLEGLNDAQINAVLHNDGPAVVFAGAGSGKTRVIITRLVRLIVENRTRPHRILAVTFTNKAAQEMKQRIKNLYSLGEYVHIGTFHSACVRWLREFAEELGFNKNFTIFDDSDSQNLIKAMLKENIELEKVNVGQVKHAISWAKNKGLLPQDLINYDAKEIEKIFPAYGIAIYRKYQEQLQKSNAMDFDDLILNVVLLLKRNEMVRNLLQRRYDFVLVDEYQDTNTSQFELIQLICAPRNNLFVVGDDDQSIYSWRGAEPSHIINFNKIFGGGVEYRLEQNYRSTASIIKAAASLIENNNTRAPKTLWTDNPDGEKIKVHGEYDAEMEAWWIAEEITSNRDFTYGDIAILYRTNAQSRLLEETLVSRRIPYKIYGALKFYDRAEIKDMVAYIRLILNEADSVAFRRIVNVPTRGIGEKAQDQVAEYSSQQNVTMLNAARHLAGSMPKLRAFVELMNRLTAEFLEPKLENIIQTILTETKYDAFLKTKAKEQFDDKMANIYELNSAIADYFEKNPDRTLQDWLNDVSLSQTEEKDDGTVIETVSLMTLHSAKGLEYPFVFLAGVEDGILPHSNSCEDLKALEEERRLFYVGITRAKKKLMISMAKRRRFYDKWLSQEPSRFLQEIPEEVCSVSGIATKNILKRDLQNAVEESEYVPSSESGVVSHPTYGRGRVKEFFNEFGQLKAYVEFFEFGMKKINAHHLSE